LFLDVSCYLCFFLKQFLEGEDGDGVLDDSPADLHQCGFEVVDPKVIEMRLTDVVVYAGIHIDGDIVYFIQKVPRVMSRWLGREATLILQSTTTISSVIGFT
jgi:hypothetical protein